MPVSGVRVRGGLNDPSGVGASVGVGGAPGVGGGVVPPRVGSGDVGVSVGVGTLAGVWVAEGAVLCCGLGVGVALVHATATTASSAISDERNVFSVSSNKPQTHQPPSARARGRRVITVH